MGLMIYSLDNIPAEAHRDYFIYLLDYGWDEPISNILNKNYDEMAKIAAENRAVVIKGTVATHFQNEVLSWHHINGEAADDLLPALLITNKHPHYFRDCDEEIFYKASDKIKVHKNGDMKMVLIPFKKSCVNETDVISIVQSVFNDITQGKDLTKFSIIKRQKKGVGHTIVDSLILQPNISGVGIDLKKFFTTD